MELSGNPSANEAADLLARTAQAIQQPSRRSLSGTATVAPHGGAALDRRLQAGSTPPTSSRMLTWRWHPLEYLRDPKLPPVPLAAAGGRRTADEAAPAPPGHPDARRRPGGLALPGGLAGGVSRRRWRPSSWASTRRPPRRRAGRADAPAPGSAQHARPDGPRSPVAAALRGVEPPRPPRCSGSSQDAAAAKRYFRALKRLKDDPRRHARRLEESVTMATTAPDRRRPADAAGRRVRGPLPARRTADRCGNTWSATPSWPRTSATCSRPWSRWSRPRTTAEDRTPPAAAAAAAVAAARAISASCARSAAAAWASSTRRSRFPWAGTWP